jgi:phosphomannomutase
MSGNIEMQPSVAIEALLARLHPQLEGGLRSTLVLTTGRFQAASLGVLGASPLDRPARARELALVGWSCQGLERALLGALELEVGRLVDLSLLFELTRALAPGTALPYEQALRSVYGTDGSRGELATDAPSGDLEAALRRALVDHELEPAYFEGLAGATIRSLRQAGYTIEAVPVGWDTRDFLGDGRDRAALVSGVSSAGADALVMGVTPIANSCYVLAALQGTRPGVCLGFNKTASHNPPSHDGLKSFVLEEGGPARKLRPTEERAITARLFMEAVLGRPRATRVGAVVEIEELALRSFAASLRAGLETDSVWRAAALVYDGAQGAAGSATVAPVVLSALEARLADGAPLEAFGCQPDGRNINRHCGAGELEGLSSLDEGGLEGRYQGFGALERVFSLGRARAEASRRDARLVYGLSTDGDSDRCLCYFYDPFSGLLRFIDGDAALLLRARVALEREEIGPGDRVAFTIESSSGFLRALQSLCRDAGLASRLVRDGEGASPDALSLVLTPVGDKWVLATEPAFGGESTGHLIRAVEIPVEGGALRRVHAGNGPLAGIDIISAVEQRLAGCPPEGWAALLAQLPRPEGAFLVCSSVVYFVDRQLFYRDGRVWGLATALIESLVDRHAGAFGRELVSFVEDPNTYLLLLRDGAEMVLSLHLRCSGTEAKIGCKATADDRVELRALFAAIEAELPLLLSHEMGAVAGRDFRDQQRALESLSRAPSEWKELERELYDQDDRGSESRASYLRTALFKQGLVKLDEGVLELSSLGRAIVSGEGR